MRVAALVGSISLGLVLVGCSNAVEDKSYTSPDGVYQVNLSGVLGRPRNLVTIATVRATVARNGRILADMGVVFDTDAFDSTFQDYTRRFWPERNIFRMTTAASAESLDDVVVTNRSGMAVNCLSIRAGDILLIMDMPNGAVAQAHVVSHSGGSDLYLVAKAVLANGKVVERSENHRTSSSEADKNRIAVTVEADDLHMGIDFSRRDRLP